MTDTTTLDAALLGTAIAVPLGMLLASVSSRLRRGLPGVLPFAPVPALAAALLANNGSSFEIGNGAFALTFALDRPGAMLLGVTMLLWVFCGTYAAKDVRGKPRAEGFAVCWLMALTGCVGVFLAADLVGFYLLLAVLSVGTTGLVLQGNGPTSLEAGAVYLGVALSAEALLLAGLVLLAAATPDRSLLIRDAVAAVATSPTRDLTLGLLIAGLGVKAGLVPLHFWIPLAHGAAPTPASAVLSGAVLKTSIVALLRFMPSDIALPEFGLPLATIGMFGALYGVAIGITQTHPKIVLAYSSVSQMGFVVAVIGVGLAAGDDDAALAAAFYAAHHVLVKGALFLAFGVAAEEGCRRPWPVLIPAAFIALGLAGLPLTGGALAKYAAKDLLGDGGAAIAATVSAVATTLLMLHFLRRLIETRPEQTDARAPAGLVWPWLATALAAIAVPWVLFLQVPIGTLPKALAPSALWSALWPVLTGAVLAVGLDRIGRYLPRIPVGDVGAVLNPLQRVAASAGIAFEAFDTYVRRWAVACVLLVVLVALFGFALVSPLTAPDAYR